VTAPACVGCENEITGPELARGPVADLDLDDAAQHDHPLRLGCRMRLAIEGSELKKGHTIRRSESADEHCRHSVGDSLFVQVQFRVLER
jgi:hypothetical protein